MCSLCERKTHTRRRVTGQILNCLRIYYVRPKQLCEFRTLWTRSLLRFGIHFIVVCWKKYDNFHDLRPGITVVLYITLISESGSASTHCIKINVRSLCSQKAVFVLTPCSVLTCCKLRLPVLQLVEQWPIRTELQNACPIFHTKATWWTCVSSLNSWFLLSSALAYLFSSI
jgi:hypothetical protein